MAETIQKKQVCRCENCGNEAEMVVTCSLPDVEPEKTEPVPPEAERREAQGEQEQDKVKGTATCSTCGNEADMWIDI
jgi:DNA-directed RNA polymerase subunit M/transcription elongation factor TFIIS